jgi:hypothetical protein
MPERENNKFVSGGAVVDVMSRSPQIEPPNVTVVTGRAASANTGLLREHFKCVGKI